MLRPILLIRVLVGLIKISKVREDFSLSSHVSDPNGDHCDHYLAHIERNTGHLVSAIRYAIEGKAHLVHNIIEEVDRPIHDAVEESLSISADYYLLAMDSGETPRRVCEHVLTLAKEKLERRLTASKLQIERMKSRAEAV